MWKYGLLIFINTNTNILADNDEYLLILYRTFRIKEG